MRAFWRWLGFSSFTVAERESLAYVSGFRAGVAFAQELARIAGEGVVQ